MRAEGKRVRARHRHSSPRGREVEAAGPRLERLLAWMAMQDFTNLTTGDPSLLNQVERIVVDTHRRLYEAKRKQWSEPIAYRWLHYEDPMPVARLADGMRRLLVEGAKVDAGAVDNACTEARKRGFLN